LYVLLVIGTRPQIIKSAPLIKAAREESDINLEIVHTGQHYDFEMSKVFFNELSLPDPIVNLGVGSGTHAWQTGKMMMGFEKVLIERRPDAVMVPGDTNSTLAGALTAIKLGVSVIHLESGCRSYDMSMPEEVNRRVTDHVSSLLLTVSENCSNILRGEGVDPKNIALVGDTMYESIQNHVDDIDEDEALAEYGLSPGEYAVMTVHRAENVDDPGRLEAIMGAVMGLKDLRVVFPCHPRTENRLRGIGLFEKVSKAENIRLVEPVGYYRMLHLMKNAMMVFTDSGGMQKEAFWLKTPCITLRENTEWVETVNIGVNMLVGSDPTLIGKAATRVLDEDFEEKFSGVQNPYDVGGATNKILDLIVRGFN